jgi:hypothetical protein
MERPGTRLAEMGVTVREALVDDQVDAQEIRQVREEVLQRFATSTTRRALRPAHWLGSHWLTFALASVGAAGAFALWLWTRTPISFEVSGTGVAGRPGDLISALPDEPTSLRFSEGSMLLLHQGGRVRVLATDGKGARVLVEHGTVEADIAPAHVGKKNWRFEVGPFTVQVTGTRFEMAYDALEQTFSLLTREGRVIVSGACLDSPRAVSAGEHLDLACLAKTKEPEPIASASGSGTRMLDMPEPRPVLPTGSKLAPESRAWSALLASGQLREGLQAAERANFARICQTASAKDLLSLGEAARLFRRPARAMGALLALRRRFPNSAEASTGAFALGRIAVEQRHLDTEAITWFATYLREQPSGPLMGDAMGRLMEARIRSGDRIGAHADAEQYLRRFPEGPYASQARGILAK